MSEILFDSPTKPYGCLSNFSRHRVYCGGTTWPTMEHWFQGQKFKDWKATSAIQMAKTPAAAKKLGRSREYPLRPDWEGVKIGIMRQGLVAKVMQHADVRETLLGTGDAVLVERSRHDAFWGNAPDGTGQNQLGKLWMEIRSELLKDGPFDELAKAPRPPWEVHPDIPYGSIGWRMGGGEDTMIRFRMFWQGLSAAGKETYQNANPAPAGWDRFYSR